MSSPSRLFATVCLGLLALAPPVITQSSPSTAASPLRGYTPSRAEAERATERTFQQIPSASRITEWHRYFTAEPHPATSPRTKAIAERIAQAWKEQGLEDVVIRRYDVLSSNPREVRVEMVAPRHYVPTLKEDAYREDPDTAHKDISRGWLSFSASGEVTAPVVYANSGNPEDYDRLRAAGIDPKGKIVIVRYSNPYSYRGFKALTAQREGAAAILVYSDPMEDGFTKGDVFPKGPWGPESHFQRGGIAYDYIVPGDPLTPGWASVPGAHRIPASGRGVGAHDHGRAAVVARREAHSRKPGRPPGAPRVAGRAAARVSPRRRGPGAPQDRHAHRRAAQLRRRGPHPRQRAPGRVDRARQPSRRVGVRRRRSQLRHRDDDGPDPVAGPDAEERTATAPDAGLLRLGRGGSDAHRIDRVGRAVRRRAETEAGRLPERGLLGLRTAFLGVGRRLAGAAPGRRRTRPPGSLGRSLYEAMRPRPRAGRGRRTGCCRSRP